MDSAEERIWERDQLKGWDSEQGITTCNCGRRFLDEWRYEKHAKDCPAAALGELTDEQLSGCACVVCGRDDRAMVPVPIETKQSVMLFRCESCGRGEDEISENRREALEFIHSRDTGYCRTDQEMAKFCVGSLLPRECPRPAVWWEVLRIAQGGYEGRAAK